MAESGRGESRTSLGWALWLFVVWKSIGIVASAVMLAFLLLFILPADAAFGDGSTQSLAADGLLLALEIAGTAFGLVLVIRRHRAMCRFWISFLSITCLVLLYQLFFGSGDGMVFVLAAASFGWLLYWVKAERPRQLQVAGLWRRP